MVVGDIMKKYLAEAIGTFCLVFAGTGAIIINDVSNGQVSHVGIALTFGLVVMAMIYAVGDTSGAHLNPAVTIGFWFARRLQFVEVTPYIASQLLGAFVASGLIWTMFSLVIRRWGLRTRLDPLFKMALQCAGK
jgi:aquaporin Z